MKIYAAAFEDTFTHHIVAAGVPSNIFVSFMMMTPATVRTLETAKRLGIAVIIDSGAHSFFSGSGGKVAHATAVTRSAVKESPSRFFARYLAFCREHAGLFNYFAELDVGELVGQKTVENWRRHIEKAGLAAQCLPVFHPACDTEKTFFDKCGAWPSHYIGVEGLRHGKPNLDYVRFVRQAYDLGVRVHGFAMVRRKWLDAVPFYSVDSAGWKAAFMYGKAMSRIRNGVSSGVLLGGTYSQDTARLALNGIDVATAIRTDITNPAVCVERAKPPLDALRHLQDHYTRLWRKRGVDWDACTKGLVP